ncbi:MULTISPECIES: hypothetical protein [unclassified Sphingomonas]|uniref:hypothetical protein n=1 Tax=unclassified Sphingomonas TaxID=196159 RepID=UPI0012E3DB65|nr:MULTISPECIES: hypothetical protein [unclassified Sphingomonas]
MIQDMHRFPHRYRLSGLKVASQVPLPMRPLAGEAETFEAEVTIAVDDVPERLEQLSHQGPNWSLDARHFLLDLPEIGRFMASDGHRLTICPAPGMALDDILVFATGTMMSAILYQRGALLLHASAVVRDGRGFIFCGPSGAGKSTLSGALSQAGCTFLSDDLCSIRDADDGSPTIEADGRTLRLFQDSIDRLGLAGAVGARVRAQVEKYHVAAASGEESVTSAPLGAIYMLADANAAYPPGIVELAPLAAAQALLRQCYRRRVALAYAGGALAARTARLLSHVKVYHLRRPRDLAQLDDTVDALIAHWSRP